jgi:hypothetical protein
MIPVLDILLSSKYLIYISGYILTCFQRRATDSKYKKGSNRINPFMSVSPHPSLVCEGLHYPVLVCFTAYARGTLRKVFAYFA